MTQMIFLEDLQIAGGVYREPAAKRGHIMMWNDGLLRLTKKEQTDYPMVHWTDPYRPANTADVAPSTDSTAVSEEARK